MANDAYHILTDANQYQFYPLSYNCTMYMQYTVNLKDSYLQIQLFNIKVTIHVAYTHSTAQYIVCYVCRYAQGTENFESAENQNSEHR